VRRRYVPYASLVCLQLHAEGLNRLPLRIRREVFRRVLKEPGQKQLRYTDALIIDVDGVRTKMSGKLEEIERASGMIQSDAEIMAGTPVFRGTRIRPEMVEHARIFVATHPKRGRPPVQPWSGKKPVVRKKDKLNCDA
jgi:hypothetical protein